jgi:hypothetical protein
MWKLVKYCLKTIYLKILIIKSRTKILGISIGKAYLAKKPRYIKQSWDANFFKCCNQSREE